MKGAFTKLAICLVSIITVSACATAPQAPATATGHMQHLIAQAGEDQTDLDAEDPEDVAERDRVLAERNAKKKLNDERINLGIDDFEAKSTMVTRFDEKNRDQLEVEKIHRLAKMCIQANNNSKPCLDIIDIDARMGKFYILRESSNMDSLLKKRNR